MKRKVLFSLLVFLLFQLWIYSAPDKTSNEALKAANNTLKLQPEPVPDAVRAKIKDQLLDAGGGSEFFCILPPNDRATANFGNISVYISASSDCSPTKPINVKVYRGTLATTIADFKLEQPSQTVALTAQGGTGINNPMEVLDQSWEILSVRKDMSSNFAIPDKALRVESEGGDVFVYVGSFSQQTADGYMVLPTHLLGTEYIHSSRRDNQEKVRTVEYPMSAGPADGDFRTGFSCIAAKDQTVIRATLKATQTFCINYDRVGPNRTIQSPTLRQNEVWNVVNGINSYTNQVCDFTGTVVWSDKPFALVSWVQRTGIPTVLLDGSIEGPGRDNLVEQVLPISFWGKEFISVQFKGSYENNSIWARNADYRDKNPGNLYRVVASEPNTSVEAVGYNLQTGELVARWTTTLSNKGSFSEINEGTFPGNIARPQHLMPGAVHWKATKPVQIMQFTTSQGTHYQGSTLIDPCMVLVPPVEQYGYNTTFKSAPRQSGAGSTFNEHFVSLYIKGPVDENNQYVSNPAALKEILDSIEVIINGNIGTGVYRDAAVERNRIPGTNYHYARFSVDADATIHVKAKTEMSGTSYGFGPAISYAWPTAMGLVQAGVEDIYPPAVRNTRACETPDGSAASLRPGTSTINPGATYVRSYWADTVFRASTSDFESTIQDEGINRRPDVKNAINISTESPMYFCRGLNPSPTWTNVATKEGSVRYQITDPFKDASMQVVYEDMHGHQAVDEIEYIADKIRFYDKANDPGLANPISVINFDAVTVGESATETITIKNINNTDVDVLTLLENVYMRGPNSEFTLSYTAPANNALAPGETMDIVITYTPDNENTVSDILCIKTKCLFFILTVNAGSGFPMIEVSDIAFGAVAVGDSSDEQCFTIRNNGSMDLIINGAAFDPAQPGTNLDTFSFVTANINGNQTTLPTETTPWVIAPGESITVCVQFHAQVVGALGANLCFTNNADPVLDLNYDNCATLTGTGVEDGVAISSTEFGLKRVCTENVATAIITNTGTFPIVLRDIVANTPAANTWQRRGDTLISPSGAYFIVGIERFVGDTLFPHNNTGYPIERREFELDIHFNPTQESGVYGNTESSLEYIVNFEPANGISTIFGTGLITGGAILPKLEVEPRYSFELPIKYDTDYPSPGTIVINNPSFTSATQIRSITLLPADQYLDFTLENATDITSIRANGSDSLIVTFHPLTSNPPLRQARVVIESDAWRCEDGGTVRYDTVLLVGHAFDDSWQLNSPNFGEFARCDEQVLPISISNEGTVSLTIDSVALVDSRYSNVLVLEDGVNFTSYDIPANTTNENLRFRFHGCNYVDNDGTPLSGEVKIDVIVYTSMGSQISTFTATPLFIPVEVVLPSFETTPGLKPEIPIYIRLTNTNTNFYTFDNAKIGSFTITLRVKHSQLHFDGFGITDNGWSYSIVSQTDDLVTITGYGAPLTGSGDVILLRPTAYVMVNTDGIIPIEVESITFDRNCCLYWSTTKGELTFDICAQVPRGDIITSSTSYALEPITPNPFTDKQLGINYSIGLDAKTTIKIFNSNGDLVKIAVDEYQKEGTYTATVNVGDLATGIYQVSISSGPFEETQSLVIVR